MESTPTRSFVRTWLPWLAAGGMLLVYLVTLDTAVTNTSVWPLARVTGSEWRPAYIAPLTWLVMLGASWLPSGGQLIGLNFFSALCAALSLGLLARSVAILPQDRTLLQRDKLRDENAFLTTRLAWLPVLLAVVVCGFQRSVWEHAIINTGEALDLLLFAYCVRCLLEYRLEENNGWLYKLALVYGLGITNNFAMIAFLPVLLVALVWTKGLRLFRFDFLTRAFLAGLAGLSLYLLLPLIQSHSDVVPATFWQVLKTNLVWQKHQVFDFRQVAILPALFALVPLFLMSLRWSNSFGDESPVGSLFANAAAVILHAGLLVFCLWLAFDPAFSPREIGAPYRQNYGLSFFFLPCYFLGALTVGYFSGFLLLVFSGASRTRHRFNIPPLANHAVTTVVWAGALVVAGMLVYKNLPLIGLTKSRSLQTFASLQAKSLPDKPAVVLSDDPTQLHALAAVLGRAANDKYILLDTTALSNPSYHRFLRKRYGARVPEISSSLITDSEVVPAQIMRWLEDLGKKNELTYLMPSFGYFFEEYYLEPHDLVYSLRSYPSGMLETPPLPKPIIERQQIFWKSIQAGALEPLKRELARMPLNQEQRFQFTATHVGRYYSRALNYWGVELQRADRFSEAAAFFGEALALNQDNAAAMINLEANELWTKEGKRLLRFGKDIELKLKLYQARGADGLLNDCGPVDQPEFCMELAQIMMRGGHYRQAAQLIQRTLVFAPDDLAYQAALANVYVLAGQPDRALTLISTIQTRTKDPFIELELARIAAMAQFNKDKFDAARKILEEAIQNHPQLDGGYSALIQLHIQQALKLRGATNGFGANKQFTNAIQVVDAQIRKQPQNAGAYFNRGNLHLFVADLDEAIRDYTKVLQLHKDNQAALLNRAIANLQANRLDDAQRDYRDLLLRFTATDFKVYYGLGEIAYRRKDWPAAREYYQKYLLYAPAASEETKPIRDRLEELKKKN